MIFTSSNNNNNNNNNTQHRSIEGNATFSLFTETILHPYSQTYQNVITLSAYPAGPLSSLTIPLKYSRLSEFSPPYVGNGGGCGGLALNRNASGGGGRGAKANGYSYMCDFDLPIIYSYLLANGYTINTDITRIMLKQKIDYGGSSGGGGWGIWGNGPAGPVGDAWGGGFVVGGNPKKLLCMVTYGAGSGVGQEWL